MKVALVALTGFGNAVLRSLLLASRFDVAFVVTRCESSPFPYYPERDLTEEAKSLGLEVRFSIPQVNEWVEGKIELLLVATYHQILSEELIRAVPLALNLHPSLLPRYRGASPLFWAIYNGEKETGLTLHQISALTDCGPILAQKCMKIEPLETQGQLRSRLAGMAGEFVVNSIRAFEQGDIDFQPQNESFATRYPRFSQEKNGELDPKRSFSELEKHFRALTPWPGARLCGQKVESLETLRRLITLPHFDPPY